MVDGFAAPASMSVRRRAARRFERQRAVNHTIAALNEYSGFPALAAPTRAPTPAQAAAHAALFRQLAETCVLDMYST